MNPHRTPHPTPHRAPRRIQRRHPGTGWRLPVGAVYVGRPTVWSNRYRIGATTPTHWSPGGVYVRDREHALALYRAWVDQAGIGWEIREELAGWDLACWCPLDEPCHADVLLAIANPQLTHLVAELAGGGW
jgi:hypothetical protein